MRTLVKLWTAVFVGLFAVGVQAGFPPLIVEEEDGSPTGVATKIKVSNGDLTKAGTVFTLDTTGGGGADDLGNHVATTTVVAQFGIDASTISIGTGQEVSIDYDSTNTELDISTHVHLEGDLDVDSTFNLGTSGDSSFSYDSTNSEIDVSTHVNVTGSVTLSGTLNLGSDICSGKANGGALVTDPSGDVVCEDDDSGSGGSGTTIWVEDNGSSFDTATSTLSFNQSGSFDPWTLTQNPAGQVDIEIDTNTVAYLASTQTFSGANTFLSSVTITGDFIRGTNTSGFIMAADGDKWVPVDVSGDVDMTAAGAFSLSDDVVAAAEMADADHGDVSWSGGVATVDNVAAANVAAGSLGSSVLASSFPVTGVTAGSYTNTDLTVNAQGLITAASNGSGGSGNPLLVVNDDGTLVDIIVSTMNFTTHLISSQTVSGEVNVYIDTTTLAAEAMVLTNKTIDADNNTVSNIGSIEVTDGDLVNVDMGNDALDADKIIGDSTDDDDLDVAAGGTGVSSLTDGAVLLGSGTGDITATTLSDTQIMIGDGAGDPTFAALSGDATMTNAGVVTVVDDSHNHVITNIDSFTKAQLETQVSDVSDFAEADGDTFTGAHDFGGATSLEIPNGTGPTVDATGELAFDTSIGQGVIYDGSDTVVVFHATKTWSVSISSPSSGGWGSNTVPIGQLSNNYSVTITSVSACLLGTSTPSVDFNIEERAANTLNSAGTDMFSSDQTADADCIAITGFSNAGIAAKAHLVVTTSGTPGGDIEFMVLTIFGKEDRQ